MTDDSAAFSSCVAAALVARKRVHIPAGTCRITAPIVTDLAGIPLEVRGDGMDNTTILADATMDAVFAWTTTAGSWGGFVFQDFTINGASLAAYGFRSDNLSHSTWTRVRVTGATSDGWAIGYGWDNSWFSVKAETNGRDGISLTVNNNNAANIIDSKMLNNGGFGLRALGGFGVNLQGSTLEGNAAGGAFFVLAGNPITVWGNYFEANGATGHTFTTPAYTVKADIIVNGGSSTNLGWGQPAQGVTIEGNTFNSVNTQQSVWIGGASAISFKGNRSTNAIPALGFHAGAYAYSTIANVVLENNVGFDSDVVGTAWTEGATIAGGSTWTSDRPTKPQNYFPRDLGRIAMVIAGGSGGGLTRGDGDYDGDPIYAITGGDMYGVNLVTSAAPETAGATMVFSAYYKCDTGANNVRLYGPYGSNVDANVGDTNWHATEMVAQMPASGSVSWGIGRLSITGTTCWFARPTLTVIGVPHKLFRGRPDPLVRWSGTGPPVAGTWTAGDRLDNRTPTPGAPAGWICVASGTPGTWKAIDAPLTGSSTFDPTAVGSNTCSVDYSYTIAGAADGADCTASVPAATPSGIIGKCRVSAADTVLLQLCNLTGGALDPPNGAYRVRLVNP
jgi:hypothetical protein